MKDVIKGREYGVLVLVSIGIIIVLTTIFFLSGGKAEDFFHNSIISSIVEIFSVLATVLLLTKLLNSRQERLSRKRAYEIIKVNYEKLVADIFTELHLFITKEQFSEATNIENRKLIMATKLLEIRENLTDYVADDFYKTNPVATVFDPRNQSNIFESFNHQQEIGLADFIPAFKSKNKSNIEYFLMKYSVILPDDLRNRIYKLDNFIGESVLFMTFADYGFKMNLKEIKFNPEEIREEFIELIDILYGLLTYFEDFEKGNSDEKVDKISGNER